MRLEWRDHGGELSRLAGDLFSRQDLSDVTLASRGGDPFPAHKGTFIYDVQEDFGTTLSSF